ATSACSVTRMASNETDFSVAVPATAISVVKTQTGGNGVGEPVQYQIVVTNTGAVQIDDVILVDTISPVVTGVTTTQPGSFGAPAVASTASGTRYAWTGTGIALAPLGTLTFTIDGIMGLVCADTAVSNTAYVIGKNSCLQVEAASGAVGSVVAKPAQSLTITKIQLPVVPMIGGPVTYQIVITNTGASTVDSMVVVDTLSPVVEAVTQSTPAGFVARPVVQVASGTVYSWASTGPFFPGTSVTFQLDGTVGVVSLPTTISNTAYMVATTACTTTRMISNETDFWIPVPPTNIQVVKTQTGGNGVGEAVSYQLVVTNMGAAAIDDIILVDTISPVVTAATTTQPGGWGAPVVTSVAGSGTRFVWSATGLGLTTGNSLTFTVDGTMGLVCANTAVSNTAYTAGKNIFTEARFFSNVVGSVVAQPVQNITIVKTQ
ncbi:MAG: hypothetical protein AAB152_16190, partial [Candidatus Coatesbacteria bacterium]